MQAEEAQRQAQQQQWNAEMAKQVSKFSPTRWSSAIAGTRRSRFGTLIYGDYRYYTHTGFGPQFLTQSSGPAPATTASARSTSRAPIWISNSRRMDDLSVRVTPNMYLTINTGPPARRPRPAESTTTCTASSGDKVGASTG